jgi:hypothetical protein
MKKLVLLITTTVLLFTSCGKKENSSEDFSKATTTEETTATTSDPSDYDPNRGIGKHTSVDLGDKWIMNFITNPDPMIDKDPKLQAQLELCLLRMPNQSLSDQEARSVLEYMRQNDGVK